jgi:hypothetical protein
MFGITQRPKLAIGLYANPEAVRTLLFEQWNGNAGRRAGAGRKFCPPDRLATHGRVKGRLRRALRWLKNELRGWLKDESQASQIQQTIKLQAAHRQQSRLSLKYW